MTMLHPEIKTGRRFRHARLLQEDYRTPAICEITTVRRADHEARATVYYGIVRPGFKTKGSMYSDEDYFMERVLKQWIDGPRALVSRLNSYVEERPNAVLPGADLRPWTRQFTGAAYTRAYVVDRLRGKIVWACAHRHRRLATAERCATAAVKRERRAGFLSARRPRRCWRRQST